MNDAQSQRGFAIALLLWMIAGMSLTVAAVIHFARLDTSQAELRIDEAKVRAISSGVTWLVLRDDAMGRFGAAQAVIDDAVEGEGDGDEDGRPNSSSKRYRFDNGIDATAVVHPSNGFVSLNNADQAELQMLFVDMAKLNESMAQEIIDGVLKYRTDFPGFRFVEELLAVGGSTRVVYDRVKDYVHPYRTGALSFANAVGDLRALSDSETGNASTNANEGGQPGRPVVQGLLTFDLIAERARNPVGVAETVRALDITISLADGAKVYRQRIWVNESGHGDILRKGFVKRVSDREMIQ